MINCCGAWAIRMLEVIRSWNMGRRTRWSIFHDRLGNTSSTSDFWRINHDHLHTHPSHRSFFHLKRLMQHQEQPSQYFVDGSGISWSSEELSGVWGFRICYRPFWQRAFRVWVVRYYWTRDEASELEIDLRECPWVLRASSWYLADNEYDRHWQ